MRVYREDLTDRDYGRLTVISPAKPPEHVKRQTDKYWYCRCECGKEVIVLGHSLKNGTTTSCGCKRKENGKDKLINLIGKKFGRLLVIERAYKPLGIKDKRPYWLCKCECGKRKVISGLNLRKGYTTSCGCYRSSIQKYKKLEKEIAS
jgi:hypothetical protein